MNETIKEFLVGLGFDIDEAGLKKFVSGITTASMRAAALGAAVTAAAGFVMKGIDDVAKDGEKLELLALKFNTTSAAMDDWGDTAEIMGIGADKAFESIEALSKVVSEAALGIGRGKVVLEKLGIEAKDANGHIRSTTDVMADLQTKLQGMDRGQAMNIMEKLGLDPELLRMFNGELGNTAKVGEELSAIDASVGFDFDKNIAESKAYEAQHRDMMIQVRLLQQWFTKLWAKLATDLMPMARAGLKKTSEAFENVRKILQENGKKIVEVLGPIIESIMRIGGAFLALSGRIIGVVLSVLGRVFDAIIQVNKATGGWAVYLSAALAAWKLFNLGFLATPIGAIIGVGVALMALYDDFQTWKEGGVSLIDWKAWSDGAELVIGAFTGIIDVFDGISVAVGGVVNIIKSLFAMDLQGLLDGFTSLGDGAVMALQAIGQSVIDLISGITSLIAQMLQLFGFDVDGFANTFKSAFSSIIDVINTVKNAIGGVIDSIGGIFGDGEMAVKASTIVAHTIAPGAIGNAPTPTQQAAVSRSQNVAQTTNINVAGGANPQATAQAVANAQGNVNKNMARNMKGAVR